MEVRAIAGIQGLAAVDDIAVGKHLLERIVVTISPCGAFAEQAVLTLDDKTVPIAPATEVLGVTHVHIANGDSAGLVDSHTIAEQVDVFRVA